MSVALAKPYVGREEHEALWPIVESGWFGMGSHVQDFEKKVSEYIGSKYCVAVNTGTSAIHLALEAADVAGKEVLVPSLTYAATVQAILMAGGKPTFVDVRPQDFNIDIDDLRTKLTPQTKVILAVHYAGRACEMNGLLEIAKKNNLLVIEDAAHAFGSDYQSQKIGSFGDMTCFSFDPIKNITCGEGGAVCTNNDEWAQKISTLRVLGISKNTWDRYKMERPWVYEVVSSGYRYHMQNLNAAVGVVQMGKVEEICRLRKDLAQKYMEAFSDIQDIRLPELALKETTPFCFTLKVPAKKRDAFMDQAKKQNIGMAVLYPPNHTQPHFKDFYQKLPQTELLSEEIVSIPLYAGLKENEQAEVIEFTRDFFIQA